MFIGIDNMSKAVKARLPEVFEQVADDHCPRHGYGDGTGVQCKCDSFRYENI